MQNVVGKVTDSSVKIGVLALQGDFKIHCDVLKHLGAEAIAVRTTSDLAGIHGLVFPGGESTALLRLLDDTLRSELKKLIKTGLPALATCAGVILLANSVSNPPQDSLQLLDIGIKRNAYGRQIDSRIVQQLSWEESAGKTLEAIFPQCPSPLPDIEGVFIRAPQITHTGERVKTLLKYNRDPVLVMTETILAATFHPELSDTAYGSNSHFIHRLFLQMSKIYLKAL